MTKRKTTYKTRYEKYKVIDEYLTGQYSYKELAKRHEITEVRVSEIIKLHIRNLLNTESCRVLIDQQKLPALKKRNQLRKAHLDRFEACFGKDKANEDFKALLSPDDAAHLTEEEKAFVWKWVYGSSAKEALAESGLDVGLFRPLDKRQTAIDKSYENACKMRAVYLRNKENVRLYINKVQSKHLEMHAVDENYVKTLVLQQIDELREDKSAAGRKLLGQNIDRLAQLTNAYSQTINVNQATAGNALDMLVEMAKADATSKALPPGEDTDFVPEKVN